MAVDCAGDQNKYWEYHDKVFREQYNKGDDLVRFKAADLKKWAKDIRLDPAKFDQCLDSKRYKNEVLKDKADGDAVSVQGTPTFFINGRVIGGAQAYPAFKKLIDESAESRGRPEGSAPTLKVGPTASATTCRRRSRSCRRA